MTSVSELSDETTYGVPHPPPRPFLPPPSPRLLHVPKAEARLSPATFSGPCPPVLCGIRRRPHESVPPAQTRFRLPTDPTSQQGGSRKAEAARDELLLGPVIDEFLPIYHSAF